MKNYIKNKNNKQDKKKNKFSERLKNHFLNANETPWVKVERINLKVLKKEFENIILRETNGDPVLRNANKKYLQCCNFALNHSNSVTIQQNTTSNKAHFSGLQYCKAFACPICSNKKDKYNNHSTNEFIEKATKQGYEIEMLTLVSKPFVFDFKKSNEYLIKKFSVYLEKQAKAYTKFFKSRVVQKIFNEIGYIGRVTSKEFKLNLISGANNHSHILLCAKNKISIEQRNKLKETYINCLKSEKLAYRTKKENEKVLNIVHGSKCANYINKHSRPVSTENINNKKSYTPNELLYLSSTGKAWAGRAYFIYSQSIKNNHIFAFSRGLKSFFNIEKPKNEQEYKQLLRIDKRIFINLDNETKNKILNLLDNSKIETLYIISNFIARCLYKKVNDIDNLSLNDVEQITEFFILQNVEFFK